MTVWKQPPIAKMYEAFTAVAGGHVRLTGPGTALVTSSDDARVSEVDWSEDGAAIGSNDNASYWQGYAGYPIIAVLLTLGTLHADEAVIAPLAGVDWHELNARFKRDYETAVAHVLEEAAIRGADAAAIVAAAEDVAGQLAQLQLQRPARGRRPPGPT